QAVGRQHAHGAQEHDFNRRRHSGKGLWLSSRAGKPLRDGNACPYCVSIAVRSFSPRGRTPLVAGGLRFLGRSFRNRTSRRSAQDQRTRSSTYCARKENGGLGGWRAFQRRCWLNKFGCPAVLRKAVLNGCSGPKNTKCTIGRSSW